MNWGAPIGFGKAGNNPYVMADMGLGLTFGRQEGGLAGMLTGNQPMSNDQRALVESLAAGQALDEIPREGLFPQLLAKTGIISPNVRVSPSIHALEQLAVSQQNEQKMSDQLALVSGLSTVAEHGGPGLLAAAYRNIPGLSSLIPGIDPSKIETPQMLSEKYHQQEIAEQDKKIAAAQQKEDDWRKHQQAMEEARAREDTIRENAALAMQKKEEGRETAKDQAENARDYLAMISRLSSDRRVGTLQDPTALINYLQLEHAKGTPASVAYLNAYNDPRFAPLIKAGLEAPQAPEEGGGFWDKLESFVNWPGSAIGGSGTASAAPGAAPAIVQPKSFVK